MLAMRDHPLETLDMTSHCRKRAPESKINCPKYVTKMQIWDNNLKEDLCAESSDIMLLRWGHISEISAKFHQ